MRAYTNPRFPALGVRVFHSFIEPTCNMHTQHTAHTHPALHHKRSHTHTHALEERAVRERVKHRRKLASRRENRAASSRGEIARGERKLWKSCCCCTATEQRGTERAGCRLSGNERGIRRVVQHITSHHHPHTAHSFEAARFPLGRCAPVFMAFPAFVQTVQCVCRHVGHLCVAIQTCTRLSQRQLSVRKTLTKCMYSSY